VTRHGRKGFTLIEVLVALTIVALSGVVVYGALTTAFGSWSAGLVAGRRGQVAQIALDRMSRQLKSTVSSTVKKNNRVVAAFDGDGESVRFVTTAPAGGAPIAVVSYSVESGSDGKRFVYREYPWPDKDFWEPKEPWTEEAVPEIVGLAFVFRKAASDLAAEGGAGDEPGEEWKAGQSRDVPAEVEITIIVDGQGPPEERALKSIIPVMVGLGT
jgi:prepilin-type N-terminal cleavage/methylation domain-containing protein